MNAIDIRGKELHFIKRVLNRQQSRNINDHFTVEALTTLRHMTQYDEDFLSRLESKGLIRYDKGRVYATDLAISSIREKENRERKLINQHILDDFEYAFLIFMNNRNEPVHIFDFPFDFQYHSTIHMQPVEGHPNVFRDWMDQVQKYIDDPTIDGYVLNDVGKLTLEKLRKEKELKAERENLEMQKLRGEVESLANILVDYGRTKSRAKWGFIISIITVILTALAVLVTLTKGK